jgi:hypothetical protein
MATFSAAVGLLRSAPAVIPNRIRYKPDTNDALLIIVSTSSAASSVVSAAIPASQGQLGTT